MNKKILILSIAHPWFENRVYYKVIKSLLKVENVSVRIITGHHAKTDIIKHEENFDYEIVPKEISRYGMVNYFIKKGIEFNPNIVICIEPLTLIAGYSLKKKLNCRFIYDCHEYYGEANHEKRRFLTFFYNCYERYYAKKADSIITVNEILVNLFKKTNPNTFLCANYPLREHFNFDARDTVKQEYDLIYSGSISLERGLRIYLETAKLFKKNNKTFHLLILGNFKNTETAKYFKDYVKNNQLNDIITYKPYMAYEKVLCEIRKSKLGIFFADTATSPRYDKAIAVKIFDYITQSIPVVINKLTMLSKLVNTAKNGWIIDFSSEELYRFLCIILENDHLLYEKGKNGFDYGSKYFIWENQEPDLYEAVFG